MSAILTFRKTRTRKDGKAKRIVSYSQIGYRTADKSKTTITTTYRIGRKSNVGGEQKN